MSNLRAAALRIIEMNQFPHHPADRKLSTEKAADRLAHKPIGSLRDAEPWDDFLQRIGVI